MPNSRSAKKSQRQNEKRRLRNRSQRSTLRTLLKKFRETAEGGDQAATEEMYRLVSKRLDQAAAKHLIHKNTAARTKSRLSRLLKADAAST